MYWSKSSGSLIFKDNSAALFGDGSDLQISHIGTKSYIKDTGTGSLRICSDDFRVYNAADNEYMISAVQDGAVELYWDSAKKFETTQYGAKISTNLSAGYLEVSTTANLGDGHIEVIGGESGGAVFSLTADEGDDNADRWRIQNAGDSKLGFRSKESGSWVVKLGKSNNGNANFAGNVSCVNPVTYTHQTQPTIDQV